MGVVDRPASEIPVGSPLAGRQRRAAWIGTLLAVAVFWLLATSAQPWRLFDEGPFTANFYDAQAHALLSGRLDVPTDVAQYEGFDVDGQTYLYFGVGPALLRLPVALVTGAMDGRLSVLSQLVAVAVLGLASARLLARARVAIGGVDERPWLVGGFAAAVTLGTPVLFLASRGVVYHEAALWGGAAGVAGLDLVLRWWSAPSARRLVGAAMVAAFAMACRPTSGSAPMLALGLFAALLLWQRQWRLAIGAAVAAGVGGVAYMAVNLARFGQLLQVPWAAQRLNEFDAERQAALAANDGTLLGLGFVPTTMWHYLSPLPTSLDVGRLFPFIGWSGRATVFGGVTFDYLDRSSSLLMATPVFVALAVVGVVWVVRRERGQGWRIIAVASVLGTAGTFTIGSVAHRYLVDLVPPLIVLAAPGVWLACRWCEARGRLVSRVVVGLTVAVLLIGTAGQAALALQVRYLYIIVPDPSDRLRFMEVQFDLDERIFGDPPATVIAVQGALPTPADGTVAILDACTGLYRGDGFAWAAVEWRAGEGRRLVLEPDADARAALGRESVLVASGTEWTLVAEPNDDGHFQPVYRSGATEVRGDPVDAATEVVDVVADPSTTQFIVAAGGEVVLAIVFSPTEGLTAAPGWESLPGAAPLCDALAARLPLSG